MYVCYSSLSDICILQIVALLCCLRASHHTLIHDRVWCVNYSTWLVTTTLSIASSKLSVCSFRHSIVAYLYIILAWTLDETTLNTTKIICLLLFQMELCNKNIIVLWKFCFVKTSQRAASVSNIATYIIWSRTFVENSKWGLHPICRI